MELEEIFGLFLEGCFSSSIKEQFIFVFQKDSKHWNDLN